jgi:hypothetical protein
VSRGLICNVTAGTSALNIAFYTCRHPGGGNGPSTEDGETEMTKPNTETKMPKTEATELTIDQLDSASGGMSFLGITSLLVRILSGGYAPYRPVLPNV